MVVPPPSAPYWPALGGSPPQSPPTYGNSEYLLFHESPESVIRKIDKCVEGVSREFQGYFKEVLRMIQGSLRAA